MFAKFAFFMRSNCNSDDSSPRVRYCALAKSFMTFTASFFHAIRVLQQYFLLDRKCMYSFLLWKVGSGVLILCFPFLQHLPPFSSNTFFCTLSYAFDPIYLVTTSVNDNDRRSQYYFIVTTKTQPG